MKFESETFFIGMIDFFSVMLPGAALTAFAHSRLEEGPWGEVYSIHHDRNLPACRKGKGGGLLTFPATYAFGSWSKL